MTSTSRAPNPHLTDPNLRPLLSPTFSPIDYLNHTLPSATSSKQFSTQTAPSISTLASQTQSHISTLNAQTSRLSTTLTGLTDDILRTSSRLAYEVELLRGEAIALAETLSPTGDLHDALQRFIPPDPPAAPTPNPPPPSTTTTTTTPTAPEPTPSTTQEPPSLPHLRTLLHVRAHLTATIRTFNLALSFPLPPSLVQTPSTSLISVAPPSSNDPDAEKRGQAALARLRGDVMDLLQAGEVERARGRVEELRGVCGVWRGTGEERARGRWVDGLEEEVRKVEEGGGRKDGDGGGGGRGGGSERSAGKGGVGGEGVGSGQGGFLRRLREEIYMD